MYLDTVDNNVSCLVQIQKCDQVTGSSDTVSNRSINSRDSGVSCCLTFKGRQFMASVSPCCVVDLAAKVYSYEARVKAQNCILEDAWVGTAQCSNTAPMP